MSAALDEVGVRSPGLAVVTREGTALWRSSDPRPWASVTKILTAIAVLQCAQDGRVDLDEPAGPPGSTVRHLLGHASGLGAEASDGVLAEPGRRRIYSNVGYEIAAELAARRSGHEFAVVLQDQLFGPLGMTTCTLGGSPAHGASGSVGDLGLLAQELLRPRLLERQIVELLSTPVFPGLDGVLPGYGRQSPNSWALGCEVKETKSPHWSAPSGSPRTFGHFGRSGSFLWVDPDARVAAVFLGDALFGEWAVRGWPGLNAAILTEYGGRDPSHELAPTSISS